jgi:hypothetical protein
MNYNLSYFEKSIISDVPDNCYLLAIVLIQIGIESIRYHTFQYSNY